MGDAERTLTFSDISVAHPTPTPRANKDQVYPPSSMTGRPCRTVPCTKLARCLTLMSQERGNIEIEVKVKVQGPRSKVKIKVQGRTSLIHHCLCCTASCVSVPSDGITSSRGRRREDESYKCGAKQGQGGGDASQPSITSTHTNHQPFFGHGNAIENSKGFAKREKPIQ